MTNTIRIGLLLVMSAWLSGCAFLGTPRMALLSSNSEYSLLAAQQQWHVSRSGKEHRLQAVVQIDDTRWTLVVMDSLGQRLVTLVQAPQDLTVQTHKSHPLQEHWVELAQSLQIIYWPLADLQQSGSDWAFSDSPRVREAFFSGILAGHIVYSDDNPWQGIARYTDNKSGLRLVIESHPLRVQEKQP